jgi:DNA-binding GntR family transcriptional regulator
MPAAAPTPTAATSRVPAADRAFHAAIVATAGNRILEQLYDQLRDRQLRMGVAVMNAEPDRVNKNIAEHTEILEALRGGCPDKAAALVHRHVSWVQALVRGI